MNRPAAHRMDLRAYIYTLHICSEGTSWERGFVTSPAGPQIIRTFTLGLPASREETGYSGQKMIHGG
jgi:hypothetical protein